LAGDRAGHPASFAVAPSTPSTPTSPPTRSERYALRSAEKSTIDKTLAERSSPDGAERDPSAESASFVSGDVSEGDDCSSGGDQGMERQRRQRDAALSNIAPLKPPPLEVVCHLPLRMPNVHSTSLRIDSNHFDHRISSTLLVTVNGGTVHDQLTSQDAKVDLNPLIVTVIPIYSFSETISLFYFLFFILINKLITFSAS